MTKKKIVPTIEVVDEGALLAFERNETDKAEMAGSEPALDLSPIDAPTNMPSDSDLNEPAPPLGTHPLPEPGTALTLEQAAEFLDRSIAPDVFKTEAPESVAPTSRFLWHGKDINGNPFTGTGETSAECYDAAALVGSATCHVDVNPAFVEPYFTEVAPPSEPTPTDLNKFYAAGHAEGFRYFEDLRALVLAWATEQNLSGGLADVDALPFVVYCRYNS